MSQLKTAACFFVGYAFLSTAKGTVGDALTFFKTAY
jgi:hypothetical protein